MRPLALLLLALLLAPAAVGQAGLGAAERAAPAASSAVVELTLSSVELSLDEAQYSADIALVCDVNATRVKVVGAPAADAATGTTAVVTEIAAPEDPTERSATSAMQRLIETVNTIVVNAAGTTVVQFSAQITQRPASAGSRLPSAVEQEEASTWTALMVGVIAGSSFAGLGFSVGSAALIWRHWKQRKQIKVSQL